MSDNATATANEARNTLDEARAGIDVIDDKIHDLLMERAELVRFIGSAKKGGGGAYRPAREAQILRRLYKRHEQPLDFAIVYRLWRELIGGFTAMQSPLRIAVVEGTGLETLARDHFGAAAEITLLSDNDALKAALRADPSLLAIVPPHEWRVCLGEDAPNVVSALPVYGDEIDAFCLASAEPQDSGEDVTLIAVAGQATLTGGVACLDKTDTDCLIGMPGFGDAIDASALAGTLNVEPAALTRVGGFPALISRARAL